FMTEANKRGAPLPARAPEFKEVFVVYPYGKFDGQLREHEYLGIRPSDINRFRMDKTVPIERCVILHTVSFEDEDYKLHTQLRAIDNNILISQLDPAQVAQRNEVFIPRDKLLAYYRDCPQLIANTEQLLGQCSFDFTFKESKNKKTFTGNRYDDKQLLQKYAMDGFARRYDVNDKAALARVKRELEIIDNLNFSSYFLITDDICRYVRSRDFYYVDRGSGANSVVAYCLGITDVCPI